MINGLTASNRNTTLETLVPQRNVAPRLAAHPGWVARHADGGNLSPSAACASTGGSPLLSEIGVEHITAVRIQVQEVAA